MGRLYFLFFLLLASQGFSQTVFTKLSPKDTRVGFVNKIEENDSLHIFRYEYLYNGNGIGIGDFNNDGSPDLFISGNTVANKLYINKSVKQRSSLRISVRKRRSKETGPGLPV
jgi:hypothetical protein